MLSMLVSGLPSTTSVKNDANMKVLKGDDALLVADKCKIQNEKKVTEEIMGREGNNCPKCEDYIKGNIKDLLKAKT